MQGHVPKMHPGWSGLESIIIPLCFVDPCICQGMARSKRDEGRRGSKHAKKNGRATAKKCIFCSPMAFALPESRAEHRCLPPAVPRSPCPGTLDLSPRGNPIQSIFGGSESSFPLLPHEKKQTPASHPRCCSWKDGFSSQKQVLICINAG